jgi:hypothetical protein
MNKESWNPTMDPVSCLACGFEPHDMIQYACKQEGMKIEDLTTKEYNDEVFFYVYENHPDLCPERKPNAHKDRYDDKSLLLKAIKALDCIGDLIPSITQEQYESVTEVRCELLSAFGWGSWEWCRLADDMKDHWVNTWWNQYIGKEMKE